MTEDAVDLWEEPCDCRVITTNGTVKANGRAVMGRGCAKQAVERYVFLQLKLGRLLTAQGNHAFLLFENPEVANVPALVSFPVKHAWDQRADLDLIRQSAYELVVLTEKYGWKKVLVPRPGCGNGQRKWHEIKPILAPMLDDRFVVVTL